MVASQFAKVYSWHKYYLQISVTTSEKANDYRHIPLTLSVEYVGTGGASADDHTQSTSKPAPTFVPAVNLQYMLN
jgi:hypothetical protein